jgi:hypothetical protein
MERLTMRRIKDVLRLSAQGLSAHQIAQSVGIYRGAVGAYKSRANAAGLVWPLPLDLTDTALEGLLFPCSVQVLSATFPQPDWGHVHVELKRKGVTLALLWEEYRGVHLDGYGQSRYAPEYAVWVDHRPQELLQQEPRRLLTAEAQLKFEIAAPTSRLNGWSQCARRETTSAMEKADVHHRASRHGCLSPAVTHSQVVQFRFRGQP